MTLIWEETGGPPVRPVSREGLGLNIIRRNIPHALGGEAAVEFHRQGLTAEFIIPARYLIVAPELGPQSSYPKLPAAAHRPLEGFTLLVLDDQMLRALDLQDGLSRLGAASVEIAGTVEKALEALAERLPDIAILDVDLDDETSFPVADELDAHGVPFVFLANELERRHIPRRFEDVTVIGKNVPMESLADHLREVLMPNLIRAVLNKLV